jgi:hypothetical protein
VFIIELTALLISSQVAVKKISGEPLKLKSQPIMNDGVEKQYLL